MSQTWTEDRKWIEQKYHNPDEPFDPYARMRYHGVGYEEESGCDGEGVLVGLDKLQPGMSSLPPRAGSV